LPRRPHRQTPSNRASLRSSPPTSPPHSKRSGRTMCCGPAGTTVAPPLATPVSDRAYGWMRSLPLPRVLRRSPRTSTWSLLAVISITRASLWIAATTCTCPTRSQTRHPSTQVGRCWRSPGALRPPGASRRCSGAASTRGSTQPILPCAGVTTRGRRSTPNPSDVWVATEFGGANPLLGTGTDWATQLSQVTVSPFALQRSYYPLTPARILDIRVWHTTLHAGTTLNVHVTGAECLRAPQQPCSMSRRPTRPHRAF
jgi:hypothetical protein